MSFKDVLLKIVTLGMNNGGVPKAPTELTVTKNG
jgi:hypothetical protein